MKNSEHHSNTNQRVEQVDHVVLRIAGDSGDGMQIAGNRFTATVAAFGNDLRTLPDFPAEIRAPSGTLHGVSAFQIHFSCEEINTAGDDPDVLVAMNAAALKVNIKSLKAGGLLIVSGDGFSRKNLEKAHYDSNPLEDGSLANYQVLTLELTQLTRTALESTNLSTKDVGRCKNFFALGLMYFLYNRSLDNTITWLGKKFKDKPHFIESNTMALRAGFAFAEATELFQTTYNVPPAILHKGTYRNINGNSALAIGLVTAAKQANLQLFLGSYPITPASDILHHLARYKNYNVVTFQAEDEIAAVGAAIGASFGGSLGVTCTSGPGLALKGEAIGLAVMAELPLVVLNVQRAGPSTGLPTKTEQADLMQALYGRHGESPVAVLAARSPADCFDVAIEAARIAIERMAPVILLSDGYIANGSEPWELPAIDEIPKVEAHFCTDPEGFLPYSRDAKTLSRPWVRPGTPNLTHRIGGLEKEAGTGNVSYDAENHEFMTKMRAEKIARIADTLPPLEVEGAKTGEILIVGWGSTYGAICSAIRDLTKENISVSHVHLRYLNPLPRDLGEILQRFSTVLIPEINLGQLALVIRAKYLVDAISMNQVQGRPFSSSEIMDKIKDLLEKS